MGGRTSLKIAMLNRIERMRRIVETDTQRTRLKLLRMLEEVFDMASSIARGEVQYQVVDGKPVKITLKQRQMWARVAAQTASVMNAIATSFDEKEIDEMLKILKREVEKLKAKVGMEAEIEGEAEAETGAHEAAEGATEKGEA